ncbi:hypothetical protein CQ13_25930 [Bradyrhizobium retamae]|uniref:CoA carboxyltransferase N-terminal domain-containing protein n=1 Tax=Bradyrhizobium retamae TaxID=1300035 RepID=A0A0R3MXA5_9BRAD|nr:hypothetical protein CQ13_25930 [Bradyrhizobium retamae]
MRSLIADLREKRSQVAGGEASRNRHTSRGKMPARDRGDLLVDPGTSFIDLSPLAACTAAMFGERRHGRGPHLGP